MDGRNDALRPQYPAVGEFHARDAPAFGVERACPASGEDRAAVLADSGRQRVGDMLRPAGETAGAFDVRMVYHGVVVERANAPEPRRRGGGPGQNAAQQRVGDASPMNSAADAPRYFTPPDDSRPERCTSTPMLSPISLILSQ